MQLTRRARQDGAALLLMLFVVTMVLSSILLSGLSKSDLETQRQKKTLATLAQAKHALIAWSVLQGDNGSGTYPRPGSLPCPDRNNLGTLNSGNASASCSTSGGTSIGRLPWKSLGIEDLRDAEGELLWYAVSDNFRKATAGSFPAINSDTKGTLLLYAADGSTLLTGSGEELAAIVIAPGRPLTGQDRSGAPDAVTSYLDSGNGRNNASAGGPFIAGPARNAQGDTVVNDVIIGISARELMAAVEKRALREAENALSAFATANGGKYPNPASASGANCAAAIPSVSSPTVCASDSTTCIGRLPEDSVYPPAAPWFRQNGWGRVMAYAVNANYAINGSGMGCSTALNVDGQTKRYVLVAPGTPQGAQTRPSTTLSNYLEDAANADAWSPDPSFAAPGTANANSNDQLRSYP